MSEETAKTQEMENQAKKEQNCKFNTIVVLLILSLLFSITSLTLSVLNMKGIKIGEAKPVVISQKYDKGQSLDKALETKKPMLVFFYVDWCGFCQKFAPTFHKITKDSEIKSNFAIAYVNCDAPENAKFVQEYGIQGFPTVFVVDKNGQRTQLQNETFFNNDSKEVVKNKALELIGVK